QRHVQRSRYLLYRLRKGRAAAMAQVFVSAAQGEITEVLPDGASGGPCAVAPLFVVLEIPGTAADLRFELIIPELQRIVQFSAFSEATRLALRTTDRTAVTLHDLAIEWAPSAPLGLDPTRQD